MGLVTVMTATSPARFPAFTGVFVAVASVASPLNIGIDDGLGNATAVCFWIGIESAKGSLKAKAEVENGHWHTHVAIPNSLPADSKLWVKIEH